MSDDQKQKPLDPTRSGEDVIGDTTGLTGVTTGSASQTSATPQDEQKDENKDHLPGGINDTSPANLPPEAHATEDDDKRALTGQSDEREALNKELASEDEVAPSEEADVDIEDAALEGKTVNVQNAAGDDSPNSDRVNTLTAPYQHPENLGEQAANASASDPTSDDDMLQNAHAAGMQMDEDEEHPQELDIARDIDKAEEDLRTH